MAINSRDTNFKEHVKSNLDSQAKSPYTSDSNIQVFIIS